ncbi:hypothetical protein WA158_007328 [Blastocystis sp. Blastoise]
MSIDYLSQLVEGHLFIQNASGQFDEIMSNKVVFGSEKKDKDDAIHIMNKLFNLIQSDDSQDVSFSLVAMNSFILNIPSFILDDVASKIIDNFKSHLKSQTPERQQIGIQIYANLFMRMNECSATVLHELSPKCKELLYVLLDNMTQTKNPILIENNLRCLCQCVYLIKTAIRSIIVNIEQKLFPFLDHYEETIRELTATCLAYIYHCDKTSEYFQNCLSLILNTLNMTICLSFGKPYELSLPTLKLDNNVLTGKLSLCVIQNRVHSLFLLLSTYLSTFDSLSIPLSLPVQAILSTILPLLDLYIPTGNRSIDISENGIALSPSEQALLLPSIYRYSMNFLSKLFRMIGSSLYVYGAQITTVLPSFVDRALRDNDIYVVIDTLKFLTTLYTLCPAFYPSLSSRYMDIYIYLLNKHNQRYENTSIIIEDLGKRKAQNKKKKIPINVCLTNENDSKSRVTYQEQEEKIQITWDTHDRYQDALTSLLDFMNVCILNCSIYITVEQRESIDIFLWKYIYQYIFTSYFTHKNMGIHVDPISTVYSILRLIHSSILSPYPNGFLSPLLSLSMYIYSTIATLSEDLQLRSYSTMCNASISLLLHSPSPHIWIHKDIPTKVELISMPETYSISEEKTSETPEETSIKSIDSHGNIASLPEPILPKDSIFFSSSYIEGIKRERDIFVEQDKNQSIVKRLKTEEVSDEPIHSSHISSSAPSTDISMEAQSETQLEQSVPKNIMNNQSSSSEFLPSNLFLSYKKQEPQPNTTTVQDNTTMPIDHIDTSILTNSNNMDISISSLNESKSVNVQGNTSPIPDNTENTSVSNSTPVVNEKQVEIKLVEQGHVTSSQDFSEIENNENQPSSSGTTNLKLTTNLEIEKPLDYTADTLVGSSELDMDIELPDIVDYDME